MTIKFGDEELIEKLRSDEIKKQAIIDAKEELYDDLKTGFYNFQKKTKCLICKEKGKNNE
jgi:hypothetical protein